MALNNGGWIWSSSLRFYWMLPFFVLIVMSRKNFAAVMGEIGQRPFQWLLWSTVGFGLFYAPLSFAAAYSPSWLVASTWQFTIVAGLLIAPFVRGSRKGREQNRLSSLLYSGLILLGIAIMHTGHIETGIMGDDLKGILPVLMAAFAFPLGNRKMMQLTAGRLDVFQRILGMIICSLPFWILLSSYELVIRGHRPDHDQMLQTLIVAICSGVVATALFFSATDKVRINEKRLAAVEATQSAEVLFALTGELYLLHAPAPDVFSGIGILLLVTGMVLHSLKSG